MDNLEEFHHQLLTDVMRDADATGALQEENFFERSIDLLAEAGEIDGGTWCHDSGSWSRRLSTDKRTVSRDFAVSGYGGDPLESGGTLSLILIDFAYSENLRELGSAEIKELFSKLVEFLRASRNEEFREEIEETSDGAILSDLISQRWSRIENIKLILVSNASTKRTVDAFSAGSVDQKPVTYNVWDLKRLKKFMEQGQAREDLVIDFENDFGGSVPILKAFGNEDALESYLAVVNGSQLAAIYDKWGPRLLESNVRSFLQARGNVNKGIRRTILEEPHMFLPYNNGIAATADSVQIERGQDGLVMTRVENLQIVNGGQTTASLHANRKVAIEQLKNVFVQMKLSVVPSELAEEVVPKISEFANTQNKVNAADFFANHPFHVRMEEFSRRIYAPAGEQGYTEFKWFYERSRGQFADARSKVQGAKLKSFDAEYPRTSLFTKTDLAKYENSFRCEPHIVSLGAQKNFTSFAKNIGSRWGEEGFAFDETWYKRLIAKAIIFRATERLVSGASGRWYEGGYRANIVTYGIAKLVQIAASQRKTIDLDRIWRHQSIPKSLELALDGACCEAQDVILNPVAGLRHIGEWAKKPACWKALQERKLSYPSEFNDILIDPDDARASKRDARMDRDLTVGLKNEAWIFEVGAEFWQDTRAWGKKMKALSPREDETLAVCSNIPSKIPNEIQSRSALKCLEKLKALGYRHPALGTMD